jgi:hypothetical protein
MSIKSIIVQPAVACTTGYIGDIYSSLKCWPEYLVTVGEWLNQGGPLDAPSSLPMGGVRSIDLPYETFGLWFSTLREKEWS